MGGVIVLLTRGMGERSTYGIPARYPVVLVERLGGLFFDGRRSCTEDSFVGRLGLYRCESLVVSILVLYSLYYGCNDWTNQISCLEVNWGERSEPHTCG